MEYIAPILFAIAAICNAFMDRTEVPAKFDKSIFRKLKRSFWSKEESWPRKYVNGDPLQGHKKNTIIKIKIPWLKFGKK